MVFSQLKSSRVTQKLLPGQIFYLKKRAECDEEDLLNVDISDGCFDHLVLILSTDTPNLQAEALILTSFGGRTLEERHPYNRRVRLFHLPIAPAPKHPDNGILLELDGDLKLRKETYVKIDLPYMIPFSMLRADYRDLRSGRILELKPRSFATLLQYVEARLSTNPKLLRKTNVSRSVTHRNSRRRQISKSSKLLPTLWKLMLVMVVIYATLAYLRWTSEVKMQYKGRGRF